MQQPIQGKRQQFEPLSYKVIGACIDVQRQLGTHSMVGATSRRPCYQSALAIALPQFGVQFEREVHIPIVYDGVTVTQRRVIVCKLVRVEATSHHPYVGATSRRPYTAPNFQGEVASSACASAADAISKFNPYRNIFNPNGIIFNQVVFANAGTLASTTMVETQNLASHFNCRR